MRLPGTYISPADTGLYYLESRYYNPKIGRFLNADGSLNANGDLISYNMYAYCGNNPVNFTKGTHEITVARVNEGWLLDSIEIVPLTEEIKNLITPSNKLAIKNPSKKTQALFDYLLSQRGKSILSGQYIYSDMNDINVIEEVTGKYPAIMGIDLIDYSPSRVEHGTRGTVIRKAKAWAKKNGIITCSWHWNAPKDLIDEDRPEMRWYDGFRAKATTFNYVKGLQDKNSEEYALMIRDIDVIAEQLKSLMDSDIPVLWRPLHEAAGGWFWWGAKGAEPYKKLYRYLHDQLTNEYGCHNLIWVWNGQNPNWYPGDEYVDIIGEDLYLDKHVYSASAAKFSEILEYSGGKKMIALTENGVVFDIDNVIAAGTKWAWFNTWNKNYIIKNGAFSDEYTEAHILKKTYQSEYVITLDELPDWDTYTPETTDPIKPERLKGDVNADGALSVADVVTMQKWLLTVPETKLSDWKVGDLCEDSRIDVFDLILMKRLLLNN